MAVTVGNRAVMRARHELNRRNARAPGGRFLPRHRVRRMPRQRYPKAIEARYASAIIGVLERVRAVLRPLMAELPELLDAARVRRNDAADEAARVGALERIVRLGMPIVIENPVGSVRKWRDADGTEGETVMRYAYGFVDGAIGSDGEDVDVYVGPVERPEMVYVIHQRKKGDPEPGVPWTEYDEDKIMLGWDDADAAVDAYVAQYEDPRFFGGFSAFDAGEFKARVAKMDGDMLSHDERMDSAESKRALAILERALKELDGRLNLRELESIADDYANSASTFQRDQLEEQTRATLGIDLTAGTDNQIPGMIDDFVGENVTLIRSLATNTLGEVNKIVARGFTDGSRHEDVAKELQARFGIAERQARLIARDQIGKLAGQVNAARQQAMGVRRFTWRTVKDERVREEHQVLEGQVFEYDDPPAEGLPGEPINCRCYAEPVFDDVLEELAGPDESGDPLPTRAADVDDTDEGDVRVVKAQDLLDRGYFEPTMEQTDFVKLAKARAAIAEGQRDPISIVVSPRGAYELEDGRHRLRAAIEANAPVKVKFSRGQYAGTGGSLVKRGGERVRQPKTGRRRRES